VVGSGNPINMMDDNFGYIGYIIIEVFGVAWLCRSSSMVSNAMMILRLLARRANVEGGWSDEMANRLTLNLRVNSG
jgi:hypothetical protein